MLKLLFQLFYCVYSEAEIQSSTTKIPLFVRGVRGVDAKRNFESTLRIPVKLLVSPTLSQPLSCKARGAEQVELRNLGFSLINLNCGC